ncbi:MAG: EF-hand domain-containing protein [Alphaproteobacteria bacterium]|nr:EF-hand domain-containing protein [Alphaproteobacteria bacterium]
MTSISTQNNMSGLIAGLFQNRGLSASGKDSEKQQDQASQTGATTASSLTGTASLNPSLMAYLFNLTSTESLSEAPSEESASGNVSLASAIDSMFDQIDANGDGAITQTEFEAAESSSGLSTDEIDALYSQLDTSGTGITKSGFEEAVAEAIESAPPMPPPPPPPPPEKTSETGDTSGSLLSLAVQDDLDQLVKDLSTLSSSITSGTTIDESALTGADSGVSSLLQNLKSDFEQLVRDMGDTSSNSSSDSASTASDSAASSSTASASNDMTAILKAIDSYLIASLKEQASSSTPTVA